jgi:hypothetical protein
MSGRRGGGMGYRIILYYSILYYTKLCYIILYYISCARLDGRRGAQAAEGARDGPHRVAQPLQLRRQHLLRIVTLHILCNDIECYCNI